VPEEEMRPCGVSPHCQSVSPQRDMLSRLVAQVGQERCGESATLVVESVHVPVPWLASALDSVVLTTEDEIDISRGDMIDRAGPDGS